MRNVLSLTTIALFALGTPASGQYRLPKTTGAPQSAQAAGEGTIRLKPHTFADKGMGGMPSHTVLVPAGWKAEGGAFWAPQTCFNVLPSCDIKVESPGGVMVHIEPTFLAKDIIPPAGYGMARMQPGQVDSGFPIIHHPENIGAWKRWLERDVIKTQYPNATRIKVNEALIIPDLTAALRQQYAGFKRQMEQSNGMGMGHNIYDNQVLGFSTAYTLDGVEYEELRLVVTSHLINESQIMGKATMWGVERAITFRAPVGTLQENFHLLTSISDSVRETPKWFAMKTDLQAKLMKVSREVAAENLRAARERSNLIAKTNREISAINSEGYRRRTAMTDRGHEKFVDAITGVERYTGAGVEGTVHLPSGYDHVYTNSQGEYLLTNDALFQPGVDLEYDGSSWSTMKAVR